jgi:hypothetical protein
VLFLYSNHEHSMLKFICVILSNAIHNIFESAINKVSWTKLYMLDDHYEWQLPRLPQRKLRPWYVRRINVLF